MDDLGTADLQRYVGEGTLANWELVRADVLGNFGALNDGSAAAMRRIKHFYTAEMREGAIANSKPYRMHWMLAAQLVKAQTKFDAMTAGNKAARAFKVQHFASLNIRPNVNDPTRLSEHAVGAAVDIEAPLDPNEQDFPFDFIADVTGDDLRKGATGKGVDLYNVTARKGRPERHIGDREALDESEHIKAISDEFKGAFRSEATLSAKMVEVAGRKGSAPQDAEALLEAAIDAATEPPPEWKPPRQRKGQAPVQDPPKLGPLQAKLGKLLFPAEGADPVTVAKTVELLAKMYVTFADTVAAPGAKNKPAEEDPEKRPRVPQSGGVDPTLAQLAMHGFMNVPPELAAALVAAEGGNLRWLGAGAGATRDFMHFELRKPPIPPTS